MKEWMEDFCRFWKNKYYAGALCLTAIFAYGYLITHGTVGIDDTPYAYYFEEGLAAVVGRWVMFLVNKVFHISDFAPFVTDLAGVLILMAAVTVWCVLMKRLFGERIPMAGYIIYACLFLSNPLHSEVFTYYLHNGVGTGYLFSGLSLCCFREGLVRLSDKTGKGKKAVWKPLLISTLCLWIAMGCYESFMIVYLAGVCVMLCTARMTLGRERTGVFKALCIGAGIALAGMILRSLMLQGITAVFGLQELEGAAEQRSVTEMLGWMTNPENAGLLGMILKRIFVMYGVFAYAYYPVKIYVISCFITGAAAIWMTVRRRDLWIAVLAAGSFIASYILVLIEGKATMYRAAQFLPMVSAWGLLLAVYGISAAVKYLRAKRRGRTPACIITVCACAALAAILWNQCTDMNRWFYVDELKYESAKSTMEQIAYELEKSFDLSKPVAFTGIYQVPQSIIGDAYVAYNSPTFYKMLRITGLVDKDLLSKYYREYGVWIAQTPELSVIEWGRSAFGSDEELVRFFAMHGHTLTALTDEELYQEAELYSLDLPSFPQEGAIVDMGDYIIVHF